MPIKKYFIIAIVSLFMVGCAAPKKTDFYDKSLKEDEESYLKAEKAFNNHDYNLAIELYKIFFENHKNSKFMPHALFKFALINEKRDKDLSLDIYNGIIKNYPQTDISLQASLKASNILIERAKYDEALELCNKALKDNLSDDEEARVYYVKANAFFHKKNYLKTVEIYSKIYIKNPDQYFVIRQFIQKSASKMTKEELIESSKIFLKPDARAIFKKYFAFILIRDKQFLKAKQVLNEIIKNYPITKTALEAKKELALLKNKNRFKIGCILPLSGKFKAFGEMALKGIQLALSDFAADHPEILIRLVVEDNSSTEEGSVVAAKNLVGKGVSAVIGPFHTAKGATKICQKNSTPIITMTHIPDITKNQDYVFRNFITPEMQANALVSYSMNVLKINRFAILYPDEPYGEKFMNSFWNAINQNKAIITGVEKYEPDTTDYSDAIKKLTGLKIDELRQLPLDDEEVELDEAGETYGAKIKEEELEPIIDFEAVFIPDGPSKAGSIAPQLAYFDITDAILLGPNLWKSNDLIDYSEGYLNKAVFTALFYSDSNNFVSTKFTKSFESLFGQKPEFVEAISYDTAFFVFSSAKNAESPSPAIIKDVLLSTSVFKGVTGSTYFDNEGECVKEIVLLEADSRGIREILDKNME